MIVATLAVHPSLTTTLAPHVWKVENGASERKSTALVHPSCVAGLQLAGHSRRLRTSFPKHLAHLNSTQNEGRGHLLSRGNPPRHCHPAPRSTPRLCKRIQLPAAPLFQPITGLWSPQRAPRRAGPPDMGGVRHRQRQRC